MARLFLSATHKSSGKTTLSLGLAAAFRRRGLRVQPFKKGPDYIDPLWLSLAAGRDCHNLDFYTQRREEILVEFSCRMAGADLGLIEGNKGLYDGLAVDGSDSNAALARLLQAPVVLVVDARGMTRGIAPLLLGYQAFDPGIRIAGVILNRLGGPRHEAKLRAVMAQYTTLPVLGAVQESPELTIAERHLGLVPSNEHPAAQQRLAVMAAQIGAQVDLDALWQVAAAAPASSPMAGMTVPTAAAESACAMGAAVGPPVRIGIARDAAFGFYYPGDLEALEAAGAQLHFFDALRDQRLPGVDGLFIGGGFPETQMQALQDNAALRTQLREAIERGLPVYAECGGLMYLARHIEWRGQRCAMVGALPADVVMHERPQGRGYVRLRETGLAPWPRVAGGGGEIAAHEFHHSSLVNLDPAVPFAYDVLRGAGVDGRHDGLVWRRVLAQYSHQRHTAANPWASRFVAYVRACHAADQSAAESQAA